MLAFSWGESHPGTPSPGAAISVGKVAIESFNFTTLIRSASPKLMLLGANGKTVKNAVLRRPPSRCRAARVPQGHDAAM